jgi:hypothetical protein
VTLTDSANKPLATLSDGAEVVIVAWRPGSADATRYCVRGTDSSLEGWLAAGDLRGTKIAPPPAAPSLPAEPTALRAEDSGRRFGQRFGR